MIEERQQYLADLSDRLERAAGTRLERECLLLSGLKTALEGRSPLAVLARGYCVAEKDGSVVKSTGTLSGKDRLRLRFYDGSSQVIVERVDHDGNL